MKQSIEQPAMTTGMAKDQSNPRPPLDTLKIPSFAGAQTVTTSYQRRTQLQYISMAFLGLLAFYRSHDPKIRTLGLSVLFPGAGFLSVGGIGGAIGAILSLAILPLSLFAWFGAGGFAFVLANWFIPGIIATFCAGKSIWEPSAALAVTFVGAAVALTLVKAQSRTTAAIKLRDERNLYLQKAEVDYAARIKTSEGQVYDREMSLQEVRMLQRFVELAFQAPDDFSGFNDIDQFQTSALRYQCYDMQYTLAFVQKHYLPSFQGYIKEGQERLIERSLTRRVMNFWKWESLWGKFTLNWDPVIKDNIMVTGYILICLALYEKLNGDDRYRQKGALKFDITNRKSFYHDSHSIMTALMANWKECAYCLFPCEPNWIYSGCNLMGLQGAVAYDSYMHTGQTSTLLHDKFHKNFESEFMNPDGSIVALRSSMTGFPLLGIAGVIGDVGGAYSCASVMPNVARRLWHVSRNTTVRQDKATKKWVLENLVGADNMDVGSYTAGPGFAWSLYAACAAEFGEEDLKRDLIEKIDNEIHPPELHNTRTGSLKNRGLSVLASGYLFRGRLTHKNDWSDLINDDVDSRVVSGPKLNHVLFPDVLVAKCATPNGRDLDMVLYDGLGAGTFQVTFSNLAADRNYTLNGKEVRVEDGRGMCNIHINGRTEVKLIAQ